MNCRKCGIDIPDGMELCENCLAEQNAVPEKKSKKAEKKQAKIEKKNMKKAKKKNRALRAIIGIFIALVLALAGCCAALIVPNYDWLTMVYDWYQAVEVCDADALIAMNADFMNAAIRDKYTIPEDKLNDVFTKYIDDILEEREDEYGENVDFSFVITDVDRYSDYEIEKLMETYAEDKLTEPYIEGVEITEWIGVDLDLRLSGDEKTDFVNATVNIYKVNGEWRFIINI